MSCMCCYNIACEYIHLHCIMHLRCIHVGSRRCWPPAYRVTNLSNDSQPLSEPFSAGFARVSAGRCRFRCFVLVLCWSLLVSAGFVVLCWFCAGLCWSLPVSLICAGFVVVSTRMCRSGMWFPLACARTNSQHRHSKPKEV